MEHTSPPQSFFPKSVRLTATKSPRSVRSALTRFSIPKSADRRSGSRVCYAARMQARHIMSEVLIVTRHTGAVDFLSQQNITGRVVESLSPRDITSLEPHSIVVGVLPLHLAVEVIQAGHRFFSLQLNVQRWHRGADLSAEDMQGIATLQELQMQWKRLGENWQSDYSECWTGSPEPWAGDCQQFRIGLVSRSAADIISHMDAVRDGSFPEMFNAPRYGANNI